MAFKVEAFPLSITEATRLGGGIRKGKASKSKNKILDKEGGREESKSLSSRTIHVLLSREAPSNCLLVIKDQGSGDP